VIKGSTTVLPVAQAAAEVYMQNHSDVNISLSGGGSGNGIKALIDRSADIANASRFLKDKETKLAMDRGVLPVPHRIAIDAICPIVHPDNPVNNLTPLNKGQGDIQSTDAGIQRSGCSGRF
jgi:phosphate transport system substrate-binding protein